MKLNNLPNPPRQVSFSRQAELYEEAGIEDPSVTLPLPFASNYDHFLNVEALQAAGIDPVGLARQMDQVLKENLGNALASLVRRAAATKAALPDQAKFDELFAEYDFSGIRTASSESLSSEDAAIRTELRKAIRALLKSGSLHPEGIGPNGETLVSILVQTAKEAEENVLPANKVPVEVLDTLVEAAAEGGTAQIEWTNCSNPENNGVYAIEFGGEPEFDGEEPVNLPAVAIFYKNLALQKLALNRKVAKPIRASMAAA